MLLKVPLTVVVQAFGSQQRLKFALAIHCHSSYCDAEDAAQPNHIAAATVQKTARNVNAAATRGREFESISSGLRALVERFHR